MCVLISSSTKKKNTMIVSKNRNHCWNISFRTVNNLPYATNWQTIINDRFLCLLFPFDICWLIRGTCALAYCISFPRFSYSVIVLSCNLSYLSHLNWNRIHNKRFHSVALKSIKGMRKKNQQQNMKSFRSHIAFPSIHKWNLTIICCFDYVPRAHDPKHTNKRKKKKKSSIDTILGSGSL